MRLVTVAIFGVLTAALSAAALYRAIAMTTAQRLERARDVVAEQVDELLAGNPEAMTAPPAMVGLRGGLAATPADIAARVPRDWRDAVTHLAGQAEPGRGANLEMPLGGAHLVARVAPAPGGRLAWAAMAVKPSANVRIWRILVVALTISALLMVANAIYALVTIGRGARALRAALRVLALDLSAPVPRPPVRELADIADGIATLARHLAEARRIQDRLGRDLARQERLAALGRVVAGVAHEVRNPLASIKLRLDLAMAEAEKQQGRAGPGGEGAPAPAIRQAIAHASSEITRLDRLVADLLTVSGRPLGPRKPLAIGPLLRARAEALAPWAALRGVRIRTEGEGTVPADADAVARALDNLLRNAVEASPDGGDVVAQIRDADDLVRISVEDRGAGVPDVRAGELFEPFFTTKSDGTGLGLAMSRAIARAHGGDVVYARDGGATRFELTLRAPTGAGEAVGAGGGGAVS